MQNIVQTPAGVQFLIRYEMMLADVAEDEFHSVYVPRVSEPVQDQVQNIERHLFALNSTAERIEKYNTTVKLYDTVHLQQCATLVSEEFQFLQRWAELSTSVAALDVLNKKFLQEMTKHSNEEYLRKLTDRIFNRYCSREEGVIE